MIEEDAYKSFYIFGLKCFRGRIVHRNGIENIKVKEIKFNKEQKRHTKNEYNNFLF